MDPEKLIEKGLCCICQKPLNTDTGVTAINLYYKAKWEYPVWGNVFTGEKDMAIALVHDGCITGYYPIQGIQYAIETRGEEIFYHPLSDLQPAATGI